MTSRTVVAAGEERSSLMRHSEVKLPTGGFLLAAHEYISHHYVRDMDSDEKRFLRLEALRGVEIVDAAARLCAMNLFLHGIGGDESPIRVADSLAAKDSSNYDMVLTNPPFGKKSFVRRIRHSAEDEWPPAVVVPDNVLFEKSGYGETIRRKLLQSCDVHTLLRLPTGIFYAQGVKANVLFFDRKPASETAWTKSLWIYDLRTNKHSTLKTNPLKRSDLDEFVQCFNPANRFERKESETFPLLQLGGPAEARQAQPGYHPAAGREFGRHRQSPRPRRTRSGDSRRFASGLGSICSDRGRLGQERIGYCGSEAVALH